jgi:hypothetical protein
MRMDGMNNLDVDPEAFALMQRYVDAKISLAKIRAAISVRDQVELTSLTGNSND